MDNGKVMRWALAGWLGAAAGAAGRDIPVYREYSRPIAFYDETGQRAEADMAAPDRTAKRSLRDAKAQEGLMGKETLLEVTFGHGASVFGREAALPGKRVPVDDGGEESSRRQKKQETSRNWLAQSLALPGLGQSTRNAAMSAMSAAGEESSWGWLADEVANPQVDGPENVSLEGGEENPLSDEIDPARTGSSNPFAASKPPEPKDQKEVAAAAPGTDPRGPGEAESDWAKATDGATPTARPAPMPFAAEMSRTREMLAEMTASVRPDTSSFRMGPESPAIGAAGKTAPSQQSLFASDAPRWGGLAPAVGGAAGRSAFGVGPTETSTAGGGAWKGSWSAQDGGIDGSGGGGLSRYQNLADPTPAAATPTRGSFKSGTSGGYQPAWY